MKNIKDKVNKIKKILFTKIGYKKIKLSILNIILIVILFINIFISFAYYNDFAFMPIFRSEVSNFLLREADYVLIVYKEDPVTNEYVKTYGIPGDGYAYKSYNCENDSDFLYDDNRKITIATLETTEVCYIYFDLVNEVDINVLIYIETGVSTNKYTLSNDIPLTNYSFSSYNCNNNSVVTYDDNNKSVSVRANSKDNCRIYFNKIS